MIQQNSTIQHHSVGTSSISFSVPVSEDFTDGTWNINGEELCISEIGVNNDSKKVYIRIDDEIKEFIYEGTTDFLNYISIKSDGSTYSQTDYIGVTYSATFVDYLDVLDRFEFVCIGNISNFYEMSLNLPFGVYYIISKVTSSTKSSGIVYTGISYSGDQILFYKQYQSDNISSFSISGVLTISGEHISKIGFYSSIDNPAMNFLITDLNLSIIKIS